MSEDIGTVRWFGESWGAPVCDPRSHVETPEGSLCPQCKEVVVQGQQGVGVPYMASETYLWWHLDCWLQEVVGIAGPLAPALSKPFEEEQ